MNKWRKIHREKIEQSIARRKRIRNGLAMLETAFGHMGFIGKPKNRLKDFDLILSNLGCTVNFDLGSKNAIN